MVSEKVGIKAGMVAKLEKRDDDGNLKKTTYFFPDLGVSVEANSQEEARALAEKKKAGK
jgi:hypothetical protein